MSDRTTLDILLLALGVIAILTALTMLGEVLRARQPHGRTDPVVEDLMTGVAFVVGDGDPLSLAVLSGEVGTCALCLRQLRGPARFLTLCLQTPRRSPFAGAVAGFRDPAFAICLRGAWVDALFTVHPGLRLPLLPFVLGAQGGDSRRFLVRVAEMQWGLIDLRLLHQAMSPRADL